MKYSLAMCESIQSKGGCLLILFKGRYQVVSYRNVFLGLQSIFCITVVLQASKVEFKPSIAELTTTVNNISKDAIATTSATLSLLGSASVIWIYAHREHRDSSGVARGG